MWFSSIQKGLRMQPHVGMQLWKRNEHNELKSVFIVSETGDDWLIGSSYFPSEPAHHMMAKSAFPAGYALSEAEAIIGTSTTRAEPGC
jgi:hypothetical protein